MIGIAACEKLRALSHLVQCKQTRYKFSPELKANLVYYIYIFT